MKSQKISIMLDFINLAWKKAKSNSLNDENYSMYWEEYAYRCKFYVERIYCILNYKTDLENVVLTEEQKLSFSKLKEEPIFRQIILCGSIEVLKEINKILALNKSDFLQECKKISERKEFYFKEVFNLVYSNKITQEKYFLYCDALNAVYTIQEEVLPFKFISNKKYVEIQNKLPTEQIKILANH